jgi:hypothetical protein
MILSNISHMLVVKYDLLAFCKVPIWNYGFGANKTWRGFVVLPLLNAMYLTLIVQLTGQPCMYPFALGFALGFVYLLFELPNSFLKRRLGIQPGESAPKYRFFFYLLDKTDSAFGVLLFFYLWSTINIQSILLFFVLSTLTHIALSLLLVALKLKSKF